ncbi:T9SS C-terminal target domain-containing protein, partial [Flavobacterium zepuense]
MKKTLLYLTLLVAGTLQAQTVNIPDPTFKDRLLNPLTYSTAIDVNGNPMIVDANNDGEIQLSEALEVYELSLGDAWTIADLTGIEYFTNLRVFNFSYNQVVSVDLSMLSFLEALHCNNNNLTSINITGLTNLKNFYCFNNNLSELDFSGISALEVFWCYNNDITSLTLQNLPALQTVQADNNALTEITLSNLPSINLLDVSHNNLTTLDLSNVPGTFELPANNNVNLEYINLKNGFGTIYPGVANTALQFACVDSDEVEYYLDFLGYYNLPNLIISSYCNFTPGGNFNTITGTVSFDFDNDGCDDQDYLPDFVKVTSDDGTNTGANFTNALGQYSLYTQSGAINVAAIIDNDYFTVTPATAVVNFATADNLEVVQNFCVTANGVHPDVEVVIAPLGMAQPGFDAEYKIIYKNKGNQVLNGNLNLVYIDSVIDYVTSVPATDAQSANNLSWNFTGLLPFETREIILTLNLNG